MQIQKKLVCINLAPTFFPPLFLGFVAHEELHFTGFAGQHEGTIETLALLETACPYNAVIPFRELEIAVFCVFLRIIFKSEHSKEKQSKEHKEE